MLCLDFPSETQNACGIELRERDIYEFLYGPLREARISENYCFVPVERKGTAITRMLIEDLNFPLAWDKVVSSVALDMLPDDFFCDKRVIVFNEMVHHGHNTDDTVKVILSKGGDRSSVVTVALVTHVECPNANRPVRSLYSHVTSEQYKAVRSQLVAMLQRYGSLLLDTEHVEISIDVHCPLREFYNALALAGKAVEFRSGANRFNLTIHEPGISNAMLEGQVYPATSNVTGVVRKGRVVQRGPNKFALLGLYYPDINVPVEPAWQDALASRAAFALGSIGTPVGAFYVAGLLSSLEVLMNMLVPLIRLGDKVTVHIPGAGSLNHVGLLDHLSALYPHIDLKGLAKYVAEKALQARASATDLCAHPPDLVTISSEKLMEASRDIAKEMLIATERIRDDIAAVGFSTRPQGLTCQEVFSIARDICGLSKAVTSAALDRLIDEAIVVTHVESCIGPDGSEVWLRTFQPDGEIVSAEIRRYIAIAGRPLYSWHKRSSPR